MFLATLQVQLFRLATDRARARARRRRFWRIIRILTDAVSSPSASLVFAVPTIRCPPPVPVGLWLDQFCGMAQSFPYTYISCPCSDPSEDVVDGAEGEEQPAPEEKTFNPHEARSNYSLFPPEHLLYCEECHELKCPRCVTEEIICWYCPSCLFETPSSTVRSEGNRWAAICMR